MKTHRFDPISFIFGLAFVALAAIFALPAEPWQVFFDRITFGWVWPVLVIGAGLALLVPTLRSGLTVTSEDDEE